MPEPVEEPSRRGVLLLLGAVGATAPVALAVQARGPAGGELEGLRFDVLAVSRRTVEGHSHDVGSTPLFQRTSWPDVVRVQLRVRNIAAVPLLVSPGQFRLRVHGDVSVMPTAWRHEAAALEAGGTRTGWIDYRTPDGPGLHQLEFSAAGGAEPVAVPLAVPRGAA